jgi:hypothetical protein
MYDARGKAGATQGALISCMRDINKSTETEVLPPFYFFLDFYVRYFCIYVVSVGTEATLPNNKPCRVIDQAV